jgi:predicted Ser/Thr protein kinase
MREPSPLVELVLDRLPDNADWHISTGDAWCQLRPAGRTLPRQGWKLHVSATAGSAPEVLSRAADILLAAGCFFKFAPTLERVRELNSGRYARGGAGKFITVYPADDEEFRQLAGKLDEATTGLAGPTVLSDRPYRRGSLVHYRYGAFIGERTLDNDGNYVEVIRAPDGSLVEDRRDAWFSPPPWVSSPLPDHDFSELGAEVDGVLLADRFVVRKAIRHANKGGVFLATDRFTGAEVIVKQARPHVEVAQDALRNEALMLDSLAHTGFCPRLLARFAQDGDEFLVIERVDGVDLRTWVGRQREISAVQVVDFARKLVGLLEAVHGTGIVLRDLSPMNVMVRPDDSLLVLDLEYAMPEGTRLDSVAGTPGYWAPEQRAGRNVTAAVDCYALGGIVALLVTGTDPMFPEGPELGLRVARWVDLLADGDELGRRFAGLLRGLLAADPDVRWGLPRVRELLAGGELSRLFRDGVAYLVSSMTVDGERLWPASAWGSGSDGCNVHHGAAGVLAVLASVGGDGSAVRAGADWLVGQLGRERKVLPGLHFGAAGAAWALLDAGELLGDRELVSRAVEIARSLPGDWPSPDVTHGLAGAGFAMLEFSRRTGDGEFAGRARRYAELLVARAGADGERLSWPVPESFDSLLAGTDDYGFAHGIAGIGAFLLTAGVRLGERGWVRLASRVGRQLCDAVVAGRFGARWAAGPSAGERLYEYWCSGSAGVGTFLLRLWKVTGDVDAGELARQAGFAVWARRWSLGTSVCHGLAGGGELLLDLAEATGEDRFHAMARDMAVAIAARAAEQDGLLLAPDETAMRFGADYGVGVAGWVDFLHRLEHGGPRRWLVEP